MYLEVNGSSFTAGENMKSTGTTSKTRQRITTLLVVIVFGIIAWQGYEYFYNSSTESAPSATEADSAKTVSNVAVKQTPPSMPEPKMATLPPQPVLSSQTQAQLVQLQQETQAKYIQALNDLQMLRLQRDIAQTNQAIISAKLATVTAQKNMVDLLSPPPVPQPNYASRLESPTPAEPTRAPEPKAVDYTVVSVSLINNRWGAVLGYQGNLYSIHVGDVLPPDGSKVVAIGKNGIILRKDGATRKVSLVPII